MFARVTRSSLAPGTQLEEGVTYFRQRILPSLQTQQNFMGAVVLANTEASEALTVSYWATRDSISGARFETDATQLRG